MKRIVLLFFLALPAVQVDAQAQELPAVKQNNIHLTGKVLDLNTHQPVPYANIGLFEKNLGTLSDLDGSFELIIPSQYRNDTVLFSSVGYRRRGAVANTLLSQTSSVEILLTPEIILLNDVIVSGKKYKKQRLGWMGGKDGVLPLDTLQGGGAVALLLESPGRASYVEKLQVRLMYNSKDTLQFRLHFYAYDAARDAPGAELLQKEIILRETSRFGWLRYDLAVHDIRIYEKKFFVGFEWIDDRKTRTQMVAGLKDWNRWKKEQYEAGNKKVENQAGHYKYHGNMMDWPGFKTLPPFTGLMIETGKTDKTKYLKTFERKTSFGKWNEIAATLNAVVTVSY